MKISQSTHKGPNLCEQYSMYMFRVMLLVQRSFLKIEGFFYSPFICGATKSNKNKQICRSSEGQNKMTVTLEVGQLLRVKCKNSSLSKIIWGYFGAPYGPQKYVFAKINPTIVFSAKNYYTNLYRATLAHSEYSGTYCFQDWPQNSHFQGIFGALYGHKKNIFRENGPHHHFQR